MPTSNTLTIKPASDSDALEVQAYRYMKSNRMRGVIVEKNKRPSSYYDTTRRIIDLLEKEMECCNLATD